LIFNITPPKSAEAGIFSFFEKIFQGVGNEDLETSNNALTINLLQAPINENPLAGRGGAVINIIGESALLPITGPLGSIADVEEVVSQSDQISIYVVRQGDSLSQIAEMFGVSVNTIKWANNLRREDLIRVGQTLVILPISGIRYTVKKGDTLKSIAKEFKGDIGEILSFNDLPEDAVLKIGEVIIIPNGEIAPVKNYSAPRSRSIARGTGGPKYAGYYIRPINGGRKTQGLHGFNGVDLAISCGSPIFASASGDVIISRSYGWNGGYGKYIVIKHSNGTQTLYAHNSSNIVSAGWHVIQGQVIGYIGSTGRSTGCHVHFEVRGAQNPF
jgi:murein DD-endopeptidase MepM/ murein hydrolase activator NlpD